MTAVMNGSVEIVQLILNKSSNQCTSDKVSKQQVVHACQRAHSHCCYD